MPRYPKLKVADRSAFPPNIRIPDTLIYASVVFALKINLHRHDVDAELYAWFSSRDDFGTKRATPTTQYPSSPRPTPDIFCGAASMQLAVMPMLVFMFAPLVAALSGDIPENICASTRSLTSSAPLVTANNVEPTIHNCFATVYQNPNPQPAHEIPNAHSGHRIAVVRWYGLLIFAAFLIVKWGRHWYQAWQGQTDRVSQDYPVHGRFSVGRNHAVSSGAPTLVDGVHHTRDACAQSPCERGRCSATASNDTTQPNLLLGQAAGGWLVAEWPEDESRADGATKQNAPGSSPSSRTLSALVQASPPLPADDNSPAWTRSTSSPAAKYARRRPFRSGPTRVPSRRQRPTQHNVSSDTTNLFEPTPHRSTRGAPLLETLYNGLNGPSVFSTTKWFILAIGVSTEFVHDPKFDLPFLRIVFESSKSPNVCFDWLFEKDATPSNIRIKLCSLYRAAQEADTPSCLLVYLTGMGDSPGGLWIFGGKVITEQDICSWLADLRAEATIPQPVLSVFLDVCREGIKQQKPVDSDLALVWSSSAGQQAYGIRLGEDLPSSFFVIALFSACHDIRVDRDFLENAFMQAFTHRMNVLEEYLQFIHHKRHEGFKACKGCPDGGRCPQPGPQKPEWESTGLTVLVRLGKLIRTEYPDHARKVSDALARSMDRGGFSKLRNTNPPTPFSLEAGFASQKVQQPTAQHSRGANKPALQASGLLMWCQ